MHKATTVFKVDDNRPSNNRTARAMADFVAGGENIWVAASDGDLERVKHLLEVEGVSVNAQDEVGYSPLHAAASYGEIQVLEYLLARGGDVTIKDEDGDTPLLVCEQPEVYEMLIAAGADADVTNASGHSLMDILMEDQNEVMINYLVSKGINDAVDNGGNPNVVNFQFAQQQQNEQLADINVSLNENEDEEEGTEMETSMDLGNPP